MLAGAAQIASNQWQDISNAALVEFRALAQRLVLIVQLHARGEITVAMARRHLRTARFHVIATIAMLTVMVEATAERVVNAALTAVRDVINTAAGFALIT